MMYTCEHCGLVYETIAYWHCPSKPCIARRKKEGENFNRLFPDVDFNEPDFDAEHEALFSTSI